ncbi:MAG: segregation/condensation protein A [Chloroflexi bacterium]|nr:segregation/condensation protein A [Chloroflexota bacterium]
MAYKVKLEVFEGPMDLLLTLIERQELDITLVSLAKVTSQYLEYIRQLEEIHPEALADFLVVAAKLIYIKSVALLPRPPQPDEEDEEEDVGEDLLRQLREYRRFREAAQALAERLDQGLHAYVRVAPPPKIETTAFRLEGISLEDLLRAARTAMELAPPAPPVSEVVSAVQVTVDGQRALIRQHLADDRCVAFSRLLRKARTRTAIIVTLLAMLEMIKQREIAVRQEEMFGEIWIEAELPAAASAPGPTETA